MKHRKLIIGIIGLALGGIVAYLIPIPQGLNHNGMVVLASLLVANVFWIFNVMPTFATGLLMMASWIILGHVQFQVAFSDFAMPTMWIIIGGLALGAAAQKTGLIKRIAFKIMSLFPANFSGQVLALLTAGTIISPLIPSDHPRNAMSAPIAQGISQALGYRDRSKGSAGLFLAAMWGFCVTESGFLSATARNYAFKGILPTKAQDTLSWGNWLLLMLPWTIIILVLGFYMLKIMFKPQDDHRVSNDFIKKQLADLGPMTSAEKITAVVILVAIVFWVFEDILHIPAAVTALVGVSILTACHVFTGKDLGSRVSWSTVLFVGSVIALGNVMQKVNLTTWLRQILQPVLGPVTNNIWLAVVIVPLLIYLLKFVVVSAISCGTLVILAFVPFFSQMAFNPALLILIVTTSVNIWLLQYMNPPFITGEAAVQNHMFTKKALAMSSSGYMILNIIGLLACVPLWQLMHLA